MIGPRLRFVLRIAAWALFVIAPIAIVVTGVEALNDNLNTPGGAPQLVSGLVYSALSPMVSAGILLVLLSIDQRIQNRGS